MKRVQGWKNSRLSIGDYAAEFGFSQWTLRYWARRGSHASRPKPSLAARPCCSPECCKPFAPSSKSRRYCTTKCFQRANYLRASARAGRAAPVAYWTELRTCAFHECGKLFTPGHPRAAYCDADCYYLARLDRLRRNRRLRPVEPCEQIAAE
jgi:hypothetical protein